MQELSQGYMRRLRAHGDIKLLTLSKPYHPVLMRTDAHSVLLTAAVALRQLLWNVVLCRVATQELSPGPKRKLREEDAERRIDVEAQCSTQSIAMPTRR